MTIPDGNARTHVVIPWSKYERFIKDEGENLANDYAMRPSSDRMGWALDFEDADKAAKYKLRYA